MYKCCMAGATIARLGSIAAEQWGMFTTSQAVAVGAARNTLSALNASSAITRVAQGVYRMAGVPEGDPLIDRIRVDWLAVGGTGLTVAGKSAAAVHRIGDWFPDVTELVAAHRRTTRLPSIRLRVRQLDAADMTYIDGLPTMTVERTIADLVEAREDLSLIADALRHAVQNGTLLVPRRLAQLLDPLALRNGDVSGAELGERMMLAAGLDNAWPARLR